MYLVKNASLFLNFHVPMKNSALVAFCSLSVSRLSSRSTVILKNFLEVHSLLPVFSFRRNRMYGSEWKEPMMLTVRRGLETLVVGIVLVLTFGNFLSPGWFNLSQVHSRLLTAAASRVYSMATPDAAPSIVVYVTVPNKETGNFAFPFV